MMMPARNTPAVIAQQASLSRRSSSAAISAPVHAPVPGSGAATEEQQPPRLIAHDLVALAGLPLDPVDPAPEARDMGADPRKAPAREKDDKRNGKQIAEQRREKGLAERKPHRHARGQPAAAAR